MSNLLSFTHPKSGIFCKSTRIEREETASMKNQVTCPVCQNTRELPDGAEGRKWKCGGCASVHRILLSDQGYKLKTLEEALPPVTAPAEMSMAAEAGTPASKAPVGPKLKTRRSKFREEFAESGASRRPSRGSSRRTRR